MKQYCVDYIGISTILANSEKEGREQFKKEMKDVGDWTEIQAIDYICDVEKLTTRNRLSFVIQWIQRMWNRTKAIVEKLNENKN